LSFPYLPIIICISFTHIVCGFIHLLETFEPITGHVRDAVKTSVNARCPFRDGRRMAKLDLNKKASLSVPHEAPGPPPT
jgi:hypothetical protein